MTHKWIFYSQRHPWMMKTTGHYQTWIKSQKGAGPAQWTASPSVPLQSKWHEVDEHISMKGETLPWKMVQLQNHTQSQDSRSLLPNYICNFPAARQWWVLSHLELEQLEVPLYSSSMRAKWKGKILQICFKMDLGAWVHLYDTQHLLPVKPTGIMQNRTQKHQLLRPTGAQVSKERWAF